MHRAADADIHAADGQVFGQPERCDPVAVMIAHPVTQETGREVYGDLVAVDAREGHLPEPGAIFDIADFALQATANAGPLSRHLRMVGQSLVGGPGFIEGEVASISVVVRHHRHLPAPNTDASRRLPGRPCFLQFLIDGPRHQQN